MLLERIYDDDLAQAGYLIGCQARGEALVVDARRDVDVYLTLAARHSLRIVAVTETHIHADYLSGTRELAATTGATAYVSGEGGEDWQYGFEAVRLRDRAVITIGNLRVEARHTPGHTPEHLAFLITDGAFADEPGYLLSGDFVFAGDVGRPDLLDEAAGGMDTRFGSAQQLYASLRDTFLALPDHVQVFPGHGSGSACGKALGALPSTTVGYERRHAWWGRHLEAGDERGFVDELLDGQPDAHAYFARMKRQNKEGPRILGPLEPLPNLTSDEVASAVAGNTAIVVDTRTPAEIRTAALRGALAVPAAGKTASYGAWVYDPDADSRPLVLFVPDQDTAENVRAHLMRVGVDDISGYVTDIAGLPTEVPAEVTCAELNSSNVALVLDIRGRSEHTDGHIPGSRRLGAGNLLWRLDELPREGLIVTYCQSGTRSSVAAAVLRRAGFTVAELSGGYAAYKAQQSLLHRSDG
ncbi:MBL fold metallo-hydrolase [Amycolatopsis thailandensis]|uniref:MBL fold metallo-hydrolase n=1 Tax=Amycolatopsis thailandensis TaxID=589330 RepID=UPI00362BDBE4